jgi:hypothetical protein
MGPLLGSADASRQDPGFRERAAGGMRISSLLLWSCFHQKPQNQGPLIERQYTVPGPGSQFFYGLIIAVTVEKEDP